MDKHLCWRRGAGRTNWRLALGVIVLFGLSGGLISCRSIDWFLLKRSLHARFGKINWITTGELVHWLDDGNRPQPVLLDVRTPAEWKVSHLQGARRVDPKANVKEAAQDLPKETPIVTYCSIGYRSGKMAQRLREAGYTHVQNLEGSIFQWANERRPLVDDRKPVTHVHPFNTTWGRLLDPAVRAPMP